MLMHMSCICHMTRRDLAPDDLALAASRDERTKGAARAGGVGGGGELSFAAAAKR